VRLEVIEMKSTLMRRVVAGAFVTALAVPPAALAQQVYVYPERGQSPQQQQQDRYQCHTWAVQQTGFDPTTAAAAPPPPPPSTAPQGQVVQGAARGAAVGAVGGAIAGDAGKGAAAGAAMGGLIGGMKRRDQQAQSQQAYSNQVSQQQAAQAQASSAYNRALAACLSGRGYTVR
jgi:YMGG-like Gly-zipper